MKVDVKFYGKREGVLALASAERTDFFLVLAGPKSGATSSKGTDRLSIVDSVYFFESESLLAALRKRGVTIGATTSVADEYWEQAMIYPHQRCTLIEVDSRQKGALVLFGEGAGG